MSYTWCLTAGWKPSTSILAVPACSRAPRCRSWGVVRRKGRTASPRRRTTPGWTSCAWASIDGRWRPRSWSSPPSAGFFFFKQKTAYDFGLGIPAEPLFRSQKESTARVASIMENTNLSKQQQVSEIMRQMLTQAQTAGQYFTNDQIKEMTRKVSAEVDLVHQQTQNQRYGSSHIGA